MQGNYIGGVDHLMVNGFRHFKNNFSKCKKKNAP
jgi:hypothetical protein